MISREAGLNDTTSKCTGVPSKRIVSNTSMSSGDDLVVKGNRILLVCGYREVTVWPDLEPLRAQARRIGIPNQANMDEHRQ
ncbi:hypothetical protein, partial [Agrobacterium tumefaciens]|uniref:hypothetical protein n=2 Tax=Agrobacterium tumefaciens TaxID=358 RepID=UPI003BA25ABF